MSSCKKDKKIKQKKKLENIVKEENISYNILNVLETEKQDSKPNMGKFLKDYVKEIRIFNPSKITVYPEFHYDIGKIFVKFIDGHELIRDCHANKFPGFETPEYYLYFNCEEIPLSNKDIEIIDRFFGYLTQFKFVF